MKLTLSWLKQHLETEASLEALCDKLTAIGLEVEGVEDRAALLAPFRIAEIIEANKHPDADRLRVCRVNTGSEVIQVVCGAPNARAGIKVVLARPGDKIPTSGDVLKLSKIRGQESQGMMCSAFELGLSDDHEGIIELAADAPLGESFVDYAKLQDAVIEVNLTPNRGDCAGVRGLARDLTAAGMGVLKALPPHAIKGGEPSRIGVQLDFPDAAKKDCPLFVGRLIRGIQNGPSPAWLQQRLRAIGLRPISALVDITNYMTFDCARPLHVFDADKVKGNLRLYPAKGGESFEALNDKTYTLEAGMTVIADDTGILSLAGVMGGTSSGCDENTTAVFIESAYFDPGRVAHTGRALSITSDARYRFERGVDPAFVAEGADLAAQMVLDLCGTDKTVVSEPVVAGAVPDTTRIISYRPDKCARHIGVDVPPAEQKEILEKLGFGITEEAGVFQIKIPSWRGDVEGDVDITEEVVRIKGFDNIPAISMPRTHVITKGAVDRLDRAANLARRALAGRGLMEAVTWSFMPSTIAEAFGGGQAELRLLNPISSDLDAMRPSILGNLIQAAGRNAARGFKDVGLFEVGPVFANATPEGQRQVATGLRAGQTARHWADKPRAVDAYDAKADALAALELAGAPVASLQVTADAPSWYHPGRSGCLRLGANVLATFGEIHPAVLAVCDAEGPMVGCEVFMDAIPAPRKAGTAKPLLKLEALQPVARDFAFVVDAGVTADKIVKAIKGADKKLITGVEIFDVYAGKGIDDGKKSIALSVTLQPTDHTLTDAELEGVAVKIKAAAEKAVGAVLRG